MKLNLTLSALALLSAMFVQAEEVTIDGKAYQLERLIEQQIGPGTRYMRLRLPEIPQNVNLVTVDLTNQYAGVENSVAKDAAYGVEYITSAATRHTAANHKPIAAQNANFWAMSSQVPDGKLFANTTRNVSIRNGRMVTECNVFKEMAFGGPMEKTGLLAISPEGKAYVDFCQPSIMFRINDGMALSTIHQCNKGVHPDEIGMYNRFYGLSKEFKPISPTRDANGAYQLDNAGDAIEIIADLVPGESWMGGRFINFEVKEVRPAGGKGTLGNHDVALVARGSGKAKVQSVNVGDKISLKYSFNFNFGTAQLESPLVETAIGGNILTMKDGVILPKNSLESYDYNTYARSLYGTSADGKTLYMMVIDKSTDPVYGRSAGLSTAKASQIARHFGCSNMLQCDGGGSAQMFIGDKVINKTTEATPRAVANCLMVFDNAPASTTLGSFEIDTPGDVIELPVGATFKPTLRLFNEYGSYMNDTSVGFTYEFTEGLGSVSGFTFTASATPVFGYLTVKYRGLTCTRPVSVGGAPKPSALEDLSADAETLKVTPNPVAPGAAVTLEGTSLSKVEVYTLAGQLVSTVNLPAASKQTLTAPAAPGLYIISATTATGRAVGRLIVG